LTVCTVVGRPHDDDGSVEVDTDSNVEDKPKTLIPLPSKYAIEQIGVKFLDALIKKGQMEMAKGAFKTQLEVLEKVHPEQYEKYKKIKIDDLAADAVLQQAEIAKLQPKTGNPMVDMLNENGIPIANSLRGIEQAIKTQKEMETQDPSEMIAKAVLEKFQTQILPGLVANIIAGRNPFKISQQMRQAQAEPAEIRRMVIVFYLNNQIFFLKSFFHRHHHNENGPLQPQLDPKSALVLGLNEMFGNNDEDDDDENEITNSIRRSPLSISSPFVASLKSHPEVKAALEKIKYRVNDVEKYLMPKPLIKNPNPQPGFFVPRKLPTRPRKMLPLVVGINENEESEIRRIEVLTNLKNNPNIAPLFMDGNLEEILTGRFGVVIEWLLLKSCSHLSIPFQIIEERPVPPMMWTPKGRHTRLRWVGAIEKEIPGIGTRFVLPSLDPTMPAVSTAYSTQGRARDEWDTTFKMPNTWKAGDNVGFKVKTKSQRFIGGNGGFDMPAAHL
uniref:B30.2/SPRY domain-containing protein n=1 Tax=Angiostrongylus cantonensis TaxID=6313 RepID=A0A158P9V2_ANGCA